MNPIIQDDDENWLGPNRGARQKNTASVLYAAVSPTRIKNRWMDYRREFLVKPGRKVKLDDIDPAHTGRHESEEKAQAHMENYRAKLSQQQFLMYAEKQ